MELERLRRREATYKRRAAAARDEQLSAEQTMRRDTALQSVRLAKAQAKVDALERKFSATAVRDELRSELQQAREVERELKAEIARYESASQTSSEAHARQLSELRQQRDDATTEVAAMRPQLQHANNMIRDLEATLEGLRRELALSRDANDQLAGLQESTRAELEQVRAAWDGEMHSRVSTATRDAGHSLRDQARELAALRDHSQRLQSQLEEALIEAR